ncbi:MAG TPA: hypothetical protein VN893_03710, partial [Bryobacteraceae bacterium]|nr:hypothetical protein [Bryobacteraceae bacterium]
EPHLVHITSDFISACLPDSLGSLTGDKSVSTVFDNTKIKRFVPGFCATVPYAQGVRSTLAWFDADPARKLIDAQADAAWDKLLDAYEYGARAALERFQS